MAEKKVSLKIMVDPKSYKVVFAEAGKEFVDFIFQMMRLPLATVVKHLNEKGMVGCFGDVYKSIESLETHYFEANKNKDSVLLPTTGVTVPLLSINDVRTTSVFVTPYHSGAAEGYVKGGHYMVLDNLEVKPISISLIKSQVKNFDSLVEKDVQVGVQEGLAILKASLETKDVLTTVFLAKKEPSSNSPFFMQSNCLKMGLD